MDFLMVAIGAALCAEGFSAGFAFVLLFVGVNRLDVDVQGSLQGIFQSQIN